jgi:hypothetical protein
MTIFAVDIDAFPGGPADMDHYRDRTPAMVTVAFRRG